MIVKQSDAKLTPGLKKLIRSFKILIRVDHSGKEEFDPHVANSITKVKE